MSVELSRLLKNCLTPSAPQFKVNSLHDLCIRTAAIYATTSLYEFHDKQGGEGGGVGGHGSGSGAAAGVPGALPPGGAGVLQDVTIHESKWDEVFPLLDQHFFQLVPGHLYEQFLDNVLCALEVAGHFDQTGYQLMPYIHLFFPR